VFVDTKEEFCVETTIEGLCYYSGVCVETLAEGLCYDSRMLLE
jgi:hypothetical protein